MCASARVGGPAASGAGGRAASAGMSRALGARSLSRPSCCWIASAHPLAPTHPPACRTSLGLFEKAKKQRSKEARKPAARLVRVWVCGGGDGGGGSPPEVVPRKQDLGLVLGHALRSTAVPWGRAVQWDAWDRAHRSLAWPAWFPGTPCRQQGAWAAPAGCLQPARPAACSCPSPTQHYPVG